MSLHQCSSDRELAQRRNTHKFSRLRSHCQEPSNSEAAWLKASSRSRNTEHPQRHKFPHLHPSLLFKPGREHGPWLGSAGRSREQAARREKPDAFFNLPVAFFYRRLSWALSVSRNLRLYLFMESHRNTRVFPENQTSMQHSRQGHNRGNIAQMHFRGH